MTQTEALTFAIIEIESSMNSILSWGPKSPKNIRNSAAQRRYFSEYNQARRVLRKMRDNMTSGRWSPDYVG